MIFDIIRFNQFALDLLSYEDESEEDISGANGSVSNERAAHAIKRPQQQSIGEYLDQENYSEAFRNDYLIPMTASVWSTSPDKASLEFPAITLIRFMWNHHLLTTVAARPTWMTILGGSKQYIDAVMADFPKDCAHLGTEINTLRVQQNNQIRIHTSHGREDIFDHVILATHGDQAMEIIRDVATPQEKDIMSGFKTSKNTAALHSDLSVSRIVLCCGPVCASIIVVYSSNMISLKKQTPLHQSNELSCFRGECFITLLTFTQLMPTRRIAWSSWNYITTSPSPNKAPSVCLTYWMNLLQHLPEDVYGPVLVTLNPLHPPDPSLTQGTWTYHHPLYNAASIRSQKLLPRIQNTRGISYAGAWTKYGFHEDGFSSGLKVAVEHLGAKLPFEFVDSTFSRGRRPVLGWMDYGVRAFVFLVQFWLFFIGWAVGRIPGINRLVIQGKKEQ